MELIKYIFVQFLTIAFWVGAWNVVNYLIEDLTYYGNMNVYVPNFVVFFCCASLVYLVDSIQRELESIDTSFVKLT